MKKSLLAIALALGVSTMTFAAVQDTNPPTQKDTTKKKSKTKKKKSTKKSDGGSASK